MSEPGGRPPQPPPPPWTTGQDPTVVTTSSSSSSPSLSSVSSSSMSPSVEVSGQAVQESFSVVSAAAAIAASSTSDAKSAGSKVVNGNGLLNRHGDRPSSPLSVQNHDHDYCERVVTNGKDRAVDLGSGLDADDEEDEDLPEDEEDDDEDEDMLVADLPKSFYSLDTGSDNEAPANQGVSGAGQSNLSSEVEAALMQQSGLNSLMRAAVNGDPDRPRHQHFSGSPDESGERLEERPTDRSGSNPAERASLANGRSSPEMEFLEMDFEPDDSESNYSADETAAEGTFPANGTAGNTADLAGDADACSRWLRESGGQAEAGLQPNVDIVNGGGGLGEPVGQQPVREEDAGEDRDPMPPALSPRPDGHRQPGGPPAASRVPQSTSKAEDNFALLLDQLRQLFPGTRRHRSPPPPSRTGSRGARTSPAPDGAAGDVDGPFSMVRSQSLNSHLRGHAVENNESDLSSGQNGLKKFMMTADSEGATNKKQPKMVKYFHDPDDEESSNNNGDSSVMIWTEAEAPRKQVTQVGPSACGATAVINVLLALGQFPDSSAARIEEVLLAVPTRLRAQDAPLATYLMSRSVAGTHHQDLIDAVSEVSRGRVFGRFFSMHPARRFRLSRWLSRWMKKGAVPVATLNRQRDPTLRPGQPLPDAWHHQMVHGVSSSPSGGGDIHLTNPLETFAEEDLESMLCSPSELLVRSSDVLSRWDYGSDLDLLVSQPDERWDRYNVVGQVVGLVRQDLVATSAASASSSWSLSSSSGGGGAAAAGGSLWMPDSDLWSPTLPPAVGGPGFMAERPHGGMSPTGGPPNGVANPHHYLQHLPGGAAAAGFHGGAAASLSKQHVLIPAVYKSGITLYVNVSNSAAYEELKSCPELALLTPLNGGPETGAAAGSQDLGAFFSSSRIM